jgi:hypothetical protein
VNSSEPRDESIARLLRQSPRMRESAGAATPACLDAETFAAWFDGGLVGAALEHAQAHVADCPRCRAIVSAMARTNEAAARVAAADAEAQKPWIRRGLAWAVPLTVAAAAAVVWFAVVPGKPTSGPAPAEVERQAAVRGAPEPQPSTLNEQPPAPPPSQPMEQAQATDALKDEQARAAAPPPAAAPVAEPAVVAVPGQAASADASREVIAPSVAGSVAKLAAAPFVIASPDPAVRWRLSSFGIERTTNGGSSWNAVFTGSEELSAGSAPSSTTCWVVGRGGTVLRSTDGRAFARVSFPERTDLTAVQAADAQSASVTTADGRVFVTVNGGEGWRQP